MSENIDGAAYLKEPELPDTVYAEAHGIVHLRGLSTRRADAHMQAGYQVLDRIMYDPEIEMMVIRGLFRNKPTKMNPLYAAYRLRRVVEAVVRYAEPGNSQPRTKVSDYDGVHDYMLDTYYPEASQLISYEVASNKPARGALTKLPWVLSGSTAPATELELGCSQGNIPKGHIMGMTYPEIKVVETPGCVDEEKTRDLNEIINRHPYDVRLAVGVDNQSPDDPLPRHWAECCTVVDTQNTAGFRALADAELPDFLFYYHHLENPLDAETFRNRLSKRYDRQDIPDRFSNVNLSFVLYLMKSDQERQRLLETAENLSARFITILDTVEVLPDNSMIFRDSRQRFATALWVKDKLQPELGYQKYASVDYGNPGQIIPEAAFYNTPLIRQKGWLPPSGQAVRSPEPHIAA